MTLARLLVVLFVCSLPAFAQDQPSGQQPLEGQPYSGRVLPPVSGSMNASATPAEPWRIMPNRPSEFSSDSMDRMRVDQYVLDQGKGDFHSGRSKESKTRTLVMGLNGPLDTDATCFTIRSYVVARDSKNSDSTHPAGYSTCQPASRYRLKTTVEGQVSLQR
jgi:hypothetical protein